MFGLWLEACWGVMGPGNGFWAMGLLSGDKEKSIAIRTEEEEGSFKFRKAYVFAGVKGLHSRVSVIAKNMGFYPNIQ